MIEGLQKVLASRGYQNIEQQKAFVGLMKMADKLSAENQLMPYEEEINQFLDLPEGGSKDCIIAYKLQMPDSYNLHFATDSELGLFNEKSADAIEAQQLLFNSLQILRDNLQQIDQSILNRLAIIILQNEPAKAIAVNIPVEEGMPLGSQEKAWAAFFEHFIDRFQLSLQQTSQPIAEDSHYMWNTFACIGAATVLGSVGFFAYKGAQYVSENNLWPDVPELNFKDGFNFSQLTG